MSGPIVVGYDGSEGATAALAEGVALAKATGSSLVLAFGTEPPAVYAGEAGVQRDAIEDIGTRMVEEGLAAARALDASVDVSGQIVDGRPANALVGLADEIDAEMIVIGHHSRGPLVGAIMGSVTYKVLHASTRPVLVVSAPG